MIGIEHEFAFKDLNDNYLDFENSKFETFQHIVNAFPYHEGDEKYFECKSLEKRPKRCYVEGFERYDIDGQLTHTIPKGLEIRTLPHTSIDALIEEFSISFTQMKKIAENYGLSPLLAPFNPFKTSVTLNEPLNHTELALRTDKELDIAYKSLLLNGLQVNISIRNFSKEELDDLVQKINYYVPFMIPYSFSTPFYGGDLFDGLSYRQYFRTKMRNLAQLRIRKGINIIEFEGFDSPDDKNLLKLLLLFFKGFLLDDTLKQRALSQNAKLLKRSSLKGFADEVIREEGRKVLHAAKMALKEEGDALDYLETILQTNESNAVKMKRTYRETGDIMTAISNKYDY